MGSAEPPPRTGPPGRTREADPRSGPSKRPVEGPTEAARRNEARTASPAAGTSAGTSARARAPPPTQRHLRDHDHTALARRWCDVGAALRPPPRRRHREGVLTETSEPAHDGRRDEARARRRECGHTNPNPPVYSFNRHNGLFYIFRPGFGVCKGKAAGRPPRRVQPEARGTADGAKDIACRSTMPEHHRGAPGAGPPARTRQRGPVSNSAGTLALARGPRSRLETPDRTCRIRRGRIQGLGSKDSDRRARIGGPGSEGLAQERLVQQEAAPKGLDRPSGGSITSAPPRGASMGP